MKHRKLCIPFTVLLFVLTSSAQAECVWKVKTRTGKSTEFKEQLVGNDSVVVGNDSFTCALAPPERTANSAILQSIVTCRGRADDKARSFLNEFGSSIMNTPGADFMNLILYERPGGKVGNITLIYTVSCK